MAIEDVDVGVGKDGEPDVVDKGDSTLVEEVEVDSEDADLSVDAFILRQSTSSLERREITRNLPATQ